MIEALISCAHSHKKGLTFIARLTLNLSRKTNVISSLLSSYSNKLCMTLHECTKLSLPFKLTL